MGDKTAIQWTDATWNPTVGCSVVSPGCTHCYAMRQAARLARMGQDRYAGLTVGTKAGPVWTGEVRAAPDDTLTQPLRWTRPRRIFVNSMSDLFHPQLDFEVVGRVFGVMAQAPQHTFQILTKRPDRAADFLRAAWHDVLPNVWIGTSAEDQLRFDERSEAMATIYVWGWNTWCSAEPLLGPISLGPRAWVEWLVVGGESGPGARPMHPDWARALRDQCKWWRIPFFFKQWGDLVPTLPPSHRTADPGAYTFQRIGKKAAGNELDGRRHQEWPA